MSATPTVQHTVSLFLSLFLFHHTCQRCARRLLCAFPREKLVAAATSSALPFPKCPFPQTFPQSRPAIFKIKRAPRAFYLVLRIDKFSKRGNSFAREKLARRREARQHGTNVNEQLLLSLLLVRGLALLSQVRASFVDNPLLTPRVIISMEQNFAHSK